MDKQGRLTIPPSLREHAKIDKELITIGVDSRVEIWSREEWEAYNDIPELDSESIAKNMEGLGI